MKICFVSQELPPETGWGGIGTHVYNLSIALARLGHDISVVSKSIDGRYSSKIENNVKIFRIPDEPSYLKSLDLLYPLPLRRCLAVMQWLKVQPAFDIIETPEFAAETFFYQVWHSSNVPMVVRLHTPFLICQELDGMPTNSYRVRMRNWIEGYCISHATKLISPTRSLANLLGEKSVEIIPYCMDAEIFFPKNKDGEKRKEKIILFAGRLEKRKGVEVLARAIPDVVREYPSIKFKFVGSDTPTGEGGISMKRWLVDFFAKNNISRYVEFAGYVPRTDMVQYYQESDICVIPSLWENFAYVGLEAMSCGVPVIASNVGGFPEMITHNIDGFLFESNNHTHLAKMILDVLSRKNIHQYGICARKKIVSQYNYSTIAKRTADFFMNSIAETRKAVY